MVVIGGLVVDNKNWLYCVHEFKVNACRSDDQR